LAKRTLKNYRKFCDTVAKHYDDLPAKQEDQAWRWEKLADHIEKFYDRMQSRVKVEYVDGQPYEDAKEMERKVRDTGVLQISKDHNEHPIFSPEQNLKFRAVHDYIVHIMNADKGIDFSREGEIKAYNLHRSLAPPDTWPALFTEVAAQACYATSRGDFPDQKVAILPMFDPENIGDWADGSPVVPEEAKTPEKEKEKGKGKGKGEGGKPGAKRPRRKELSVEQRRELWQRFITETVPNTNPDTRDSHPKVQRGTLFQHGGADRQRVLQEWQQMVDREER
jgi:hypothetical protein